VQLLVCDWLLTTRTEIWQRQSAAAASTGSGIDSEAVATATVYTEDLTSFQRDLATLRRLAQQWRPAINKVSAL